MSALMSALQWPIILTKLGYLIDNPWNNTLDRAKAAGSVLMQRHVGVRPITLIGFSLGARVIIYALIELAKHKAYGIVQDVLILGTTVSVSTRMWCVSGHYVNAFARKDWVLNSPLRATNGGIVGHMGYRTFIPLILDPLGFPLFSDYFDHSVEPDFEGDRMVEREEDKNKKKGWFSSKKELTRRSPSPDLPLRAVCRSTAVHRSPTTNPSDAASKIPVHARFDLNAIEDVLGRAELNPDELKSPIGESVRGARYPTTHEPLRVRTTATNSPSSGDDRPAPLTPRAHTTTDSDALTSLAHGRECRYG
ncbi:hypothetical protein B0H16DRAFT_1733798 [Mycena metata]|uniref:DUF726-domain-containing protein n=1 Tax=Mycena metata TaxID=1033252 RepID=A0AAD7MS99_9AGAR|nr:hypothetical protein B0H16DRAFT_1740034 [Mycena metata]KAJ7730457.1 hypothetical protein B0H16DRAFT_1733798 [Mycena metata]